MNKLCKYLNTKQRNTIFNMFKKNKKSRAITSSFYPNIKPEEERNPLHWEEVSKYFEGLTYDDVATALKSKNVDKINEISIITEHDNGEIFKFLLLPNGTTLYFEDINETNDRSTNSIEYYIQQVYWDEDNNRFYYDSTVSWLSDVTYEINDSITMDVAFGGDTDFYGQFGWWPHVEIKQENGVIAKVPLLYLGEAVFHGELGYIFDSHVTRYGYVNNNCETTTLEGDVLHAPDGYDEFGFELGFAFIVPSKWNSPQWIFEEKLPLGITSYYPIDFKVNDGICSKYQPKYFRFPRMASSAEHFNILEKPFNNFFLQIPLFTPDLENIGDNEFKSYEMSTYTICYDDDYNFRAYFQLII